MKTVRSFVGMDVHKTTISISIAEDGRSGPIRFGPTEQSNQIHNSAFYSEAEAGRSLPSRPYPNS
jgi:hypothetical protein